MGAPFIRDPVGPELLYCLHDTTDDIRTIANSWSFEYVSVPAQSVGVFAPSFNNSHQLWKRGEMGSGWAVILLLQDRQARRASASGWIRSVSEYDSQWKCYDEPERRRWFMTTWFLQYGTQTKASHIYYHVSRLRLAFFLVVKVRLVLLTPWVVSVLGSLSGWKAKSWETRTENCGFIYDASLFRRQTR